MLPNRTHTLDVPDVGLFTFRKRSLWLQLRIEGEAERLTGGPVDRGSLQDFAMTVATLEALTVSGPEGWDLTDIDPLDDVAFGRVLKVFRGLRDAEEKFRTGAKA